MNSLLQLTCINTCISIEWLNLSILPIHVHVIACLNFGNSLKNFNYMYMYMIIIMCRVCKHQIFIVYRQFQCSIALLVSSQPHLDQVEPQQ